MLFLWRNFLCLVWKMRKYFFFQSFNDWLINVCVWKLWKYDVNTSKSEAEILPISGWSKGGCVLFGPVPGLCKTSIDQLLLNGVESLLLSFCGRLIRFFIVENQKPTKNCGVVELDNCPLYIILYLVWQT